MKGHLIGSEERHDDGYIKIWRDMIRTSINHSRGINLSRMCESYKKREMYESRCYLLSTQFEDDCLWLDIDDEGIGKARKGWRAGERHNCAVCGKRAYPAYYACGRKVCWEHQQIIQAYNNGYDLDEVMKEIAKKAKKPAQMELQEFVQVKRTLDQKIILTEQGPRFAPKLTDEQKAYIRESYNAGRKARFLALRFGVTPRTINMVVKTCS